MRVKTEARQQAIVKAAKEVFREMGYERASMSEIAARIGGSKGTLYNYFKSKEDLFVETMKVSDEVVGVFGPLKELDRTMSSIQEFRGSLEKFAADYLKLSLMPDMLAIRRNLIAVGGDLARNTFERGPKQSFEVVAEYLAAAMKRGYLRKTDPWIAAQHLLQLVEAEHIQAVFMGVLETVSPKMINDAVARALEVFWRAYTKEA